MTHEVLLFWVPAEGVGVKLGTAPLLGEFFIWIMQLSHPVGKARTAAGAHYQPPACWAGRGAMPETKPVPTEGLRPLAGAHDICSAELEGGG